MDWRNASLNDVERLFRALQQARPDDLELIKQIINRVQPDPELQHGRITISSLLQLLAQTNGSTILPDNIVTLLQQPESLPLQSASYDQARLIMGSDFITPCQVMEAQSGVEYTLEQMAMFSRTLPNQEKLLQLRGYILIPGPHRPLSLLEVRALKPDDFYWNEGGWYKDENFSSHDKVEVGWLALRKTEAADSLWENWDQQIDSMFNNEYVLNAGEVAWGLITYYAVNGIQLLSSKYVRTVSRADDGSCVSMGDFDDKGLDICRCSESSTSSNLGLAVAWQLVPQPLARFKEHIRAAMRERRKQREE